MHADSKPQSLMGMWLGTCSDAQLLQNSFCCLNRRICTDSSSPRFSVTSCSNFQLVFFKRSVNTPQDQNHWGAQERIRCC